MTKILLATESFPYGRGEKTFVLPELARLSKEYDVTVISHADETQAAEGAQGTGLPEGVGLIWHPRPRLTGYDKAKALLCFLADRDGRREIREILRGRKQCGARLYQSLSFYAQTLAEQSLLQKSGLLSKKDEKEKIVYYSFWYDYYCYSMVREKKRHPDVRVITRTHGRDLYHERVSGGRQPFRAQMEKGLDGIVFACAYGKKYYDEHVRNPDFPADRLFVCRLGTKSAFRFMPLHETGPWRLVSCSNVVPLKRIEQIIDGLAMIDDLPLCWTHIGDGENFEAVKAYAEKKLSGKENIQYAFTGFLEDVDVWYRENQADCFITTSSTEGGCPVSIQEAMSYGIPIIATDVGGITEMIAGNGILLSAAPEAGEVARAVGRLCRMPKEELAAMKQKSLLLWREMFDMEDSYHRIKAVMDKFLARKD